MPSPAAAHDEEEAAGANARQLTEAWATVHHAIDTHLLSSSSSDASAAALNLKAAVPPQALQQLMAAGLGGLVLEYVVEGLDAELRQEVAPRFWAFFEGEERDGGGPTCMEEEEEAAATAAVHTPLWVSRRLPAALGYAHSALAQRQDRLRAAAAAFPSVLTGEGEGSVREEGEALRARLAAVVFNTAPAAFETWLACYLRSSLRARHRSWQRKSLSGGQTQDDDADDAMSLEEEDQEPEEEDGDGAVMVVEEAAAANAWACLRALGWLPLVQGTVTAVVKREIERHVSRACKGEYEAPCLPRVHAWRDGVLTPWLRGLMLGGGDDAEQQGAEQEQEEQQERCFGEWGLRHAFSVYEAFAGLRIGEMFDVVREFPDSLAAVQELRLALEITQQHRQLTDALRESMRRRLLHNGANTTQIIDVYIATIKALRVVDPSDALLEAVARPIRTYLQGRRDTVRCIVTSLTDEGSGDLYEELRRQDAQPLEAGADSDDEDQGPGAEWTPAAREDDTHGAGLLLQHPHHRRSQAPTTTAAPSSGDILSMLVSIYGSQDTFVTEVRLLLAERLLGNLAYDTDKEKRVTLTFPPNTRLINLTYDTDKEVQNLELLKLRFGDQALHDCQIMVRDVEDSKRVNANVHARLKAQARSLTVQEQEEATAVDATIVSHHFWPPLQEQEALQLHPRIQSKLEAYTQAYAVLRNPRKVDFKPQLGTVTLELDFDNGVSRSFTVAPVHASLVLHFQDRDEWTQAELARAAGLSPEVVARKMTFWANQGVVQVLLNGAGPSDHQYTLVRNPDPDHPLRHISGLAAPSGSSSTHVGMGMMDDEEGGLGMGGALSAEAQAAAETGVYLSYILGMLGTYGGRTLRAIHDTLKIWASGGDAGSQQKYTMKLPALERLLGQLVLEEKVEVVDGIYQLKGKRGV